MTYLISGLIPMHHISLNRVHLHSSMSNVLMATMRGKGKRKGKNDDSWFVASL